MNNNNELKPLAKKLPDEIITHIMDLISRPADKTKFESDNNSIHVQKIMGHEIMNINIKHYPHGNEIIKSLFHTPDSKSNFKDTIKQMASDGMRNKEIAELLDISPSYVSKLKRK